MYVSCSGILLCCPVLYCLVLSLEWATDRPKERVEKTTTRAADNNRRAVTTHGTSLGCLDPRWYVPLKKQLGWVAPYSCDKEAKRKADSEDKRERCGAKRVSGRNAIEVYLDASVLNWCS